MYAFALRRGASYVHIRQCTHPCVTNITYLRTYVCVCTHVNTIKTYADFVVLPSISLGSIRPSVGENQSVICTAQVISASSYSAFFTWSTPKSVTIDNKRVTILPMTFDGSNYTSILQFTYLMESDIGIYACDVTINNSTTVKFVEMQYIDSKF